MEYLKASKEFQFYRASLFRFANSNDKIAKITASTTIGRKPAFTKKIEDEVQKYLVDMQVMFYKLTKGTFTILPTNLYKHSPSI